MQKELNLWSMSVFMISMLHWCPSKLRRTLPSSCRSSTPSRRWWWRWHATSSWLMRSNTTPWRLMVIYISCASSHSSSLSRNMAKTFIYCVLCFRWYVWACLKCTPMIWSVPLLSEQRVSCRNWSFTCCMVIKSSIASESLTHFQNVLSVTC